MKKSKRLLGRRGFLLGGTACLTASHRAQAEAPAPARAITRGPRFHWFGYYDKFQFDPTNRYALGVWNTFQHRSPTAQDKLGIGMVDLEDDNRWIGLDETHAWSWHQTCMLQWLPGSQSEIIFNDRQGRRFVSHILDVRTRKKRTLPGPIYCVSPDARWALTTDFRRLHNLRPETGYTGIEDPYRDEPAPEETGIWRIDLATGKTELILSYADVVKIPFEGGDWTGAKYWFNHLLISPDGKRFVFLHRWRVPSQGRRFTTRMFSADPDGKNLRLLDSSGRTSHFIWRDPQHLLVWTRHPSHESTFYIFRDQSDHVEAVDPENLTHNGHCSYLPGNRWILTDTGPDEERLQNVYLYDTKTRRKVSLGYYHSPPPYTGEWRCDTTPRASRDGRRVIFDSPHGGNGRQMYLVDISSVVDAA